MSALIASALLIVGSIGLSGLIKSSSYLSEIAETSPLVDCAMELKLAVLSDQLMLMEAMESTHPDEMQQTLR